MKQFLCDKLYGADYSITSMADYKLKRFVKFVTDRIKE